MRSCTASRRRAIADAPALVPPHRFTVNVAARLPGPAQTSERADQNMTIGNWKTTIKLLQMMDGP
jgi:hypothetical protein